MPTFDPTPLEYRYGLNGHDTIGWDRRYYSPDGDAWCRFGKGLECVNGDECKNKNHRRGEEFHA